MGFNLRRIFNPTPEEQEEDWVRYIEICKQNIKDKRCCTCAHCYDVPGYHPGFVTGGEIDCDLGRCPIETCENYELNKELLIFRKGGFHE